MSRRLPSSYKTHKPWPTCVATATRLAPAMSIPRPRAGRFSSAKACTAIARPSPVRSAKCWSTAGPSQIRSCYRSRGTCRASGCVARSEPRLGPCDLYVLSLLHATADELRMPMQEIIRPAAACRRARLQQAGRVWIAAVELPGGPADSMKVQPIVPALRFVEAHHAVEAAVGAGRAPFGHEKRQAER